MSDPLRICLRDLKVSCQHSGFEELNVADSGWPVGKRDCLMECFAGRPDFCLMRENEALSHRNPVARDAREVERFIEPSEVEQGTAHSPRRVGAPKSGDP